MTVETIDAEIPYLRSELRSVQVEFESRILDERTVERRAMPVRERADRDGAAVAGA